MKNYFIYKITNTVNQKFYIGKTCRTVEKRFAEHINKSKKKDNSPIHLAMAKYGIENFKIETIETLHSIEDMNLRERYWIDYYKQECPNKFYNLANGGDGGPTCNNYSWWNDGVRDYYFSPEEEIPDNLVRGRVKATADNSDTIWINNGTIQKHIKIKDIDKYLGWNKGMLDRGDSWKECATKRITNKEVQEKAQQRAREFRLNNPHFINSGSFKKGMTPSNKGKIWITNGVTNKYILPHELEYWVKLGWSRGVTTKRNIDKINC